MTVQNLNSNISDESDDMVSLPPEDVYRRKYQLLLERCQVLQQDNERIVNRIHAAKKITKRYRKDVKLLIEKLDSLGDPFRTAGAEVDIKPDVLIRPGRPVTVKSEKVSLPRAVEKQISNSGKKPGQKRKYTKSEKTERDPNAPKKPCNAYLQFCQEQRPIVTAESTNETGIEPTKTEVTKQLASKWRSLTSEDKKVYVAMFERSKEKYAEEMSAYVRKDL